MSPIENAIHLHASAQCILPLSEVWGFTNKGRGRGSDSQEIMKRRPDCLVEGYPRQSTRPSYSHTGTYTTLV